MITSTATALALAAGIYTGQGTWHDSSGVSHRYDIQMKIEKLASGSIRQWFKHAFVEEGSSVIEQTLEWVPRENGIFEVNLVGTPLRGRGYCSSTACHYALPVPNNLVEGTLLFGASAALITTLGSAEKNAEGNYIWWEETLERASSHP